MAVCKEILRGSTDILDINAIKLKRKYSFDLEFGAKTGQLTSRLDIVLCGIKIHWRADVADNERINKTIALLRERSPNISDDLQSSRVALKHYLGETVAGEGLDKHKWSSYKAACQKLQNICMAAWDGKEEVMSPQDRFAPPSKPQGIPSADNVASVYSKLVPNTKIQGVRGAWATCYNMKWNKLVQDSRDSECSSSKASAGLDIPAMCFGVRKPNETRSSFTIYLCVEKVRTAHIMVQCTYKAASNDIHVNLPLSLVTSTEAIASHFEDVMSGCTVSLFSVRLASFGSFCSGHLSCGKASSIQKAFQLMKPEKKELKKLEKLAGSSTSNSEAASANPQNNNMPGVKNAVESSVEPEPSSHKLHGQVNVNSFEQDFHEGLRLLVSDTSNLVQGFEQIPEEHKHFSKHESSANEKESAQDLLDVAASIFKHIDDLPDEVEAAADCIETECRAATAEDSVTKVESNIAREYVENNPQASKNHGGSGLLTEEHDIETVLNSEHCLGNMQQQQDDDNDNSDSADSPPPDDQLDIDASLRCLAAGYIMSLCFLCQREGCGNLICTAQFVIVTLSSL